MKRFTIKKLTSGCLLALGTCAGGLAHADTTYTYTYDYTFNVNGCSGWNASCGLTGNQSSSSATPLPAPADPNAPAVSLTATATGWANTQGDSYTGSGTGSSNPTYYSAQTIEQGMVQAWGGGLGVLNDDYASHDGETRTDSGEGTDPEHATDNNGRYDSVLYSFGQAVSLTGVTLSWYSGDSDLSILAYTGDTSAAGFDITSKLTNLRYDKLAENGWSFIGHLTSGGYNQTLTTATSSSYWLIGAANPLVGAGLNDSTKDNVKIAALSGVITNQFTKQDSPTPGVPEPGSLALLGLGSLLLVGARTKKAKR